jgi:hypothetical protein
LVVPALIPSCRVIIFHKAPDGRSLAIFAMSTITRGLPSARIAGHNDIRISARYVHPSEDGVLNAVSRMGGHKIGHKRLESS